MLLTGVISYRPLIKQLLKMYLLLSIGLVETSTFNSSGGGAGMSGPYSSKCNRTCEVAGARLLIVPSINRLANFAQKSWSSTAPSVSVSSRLRISIGDPGGVDGAVATRLGGS